MNRKQFTVIGFLGIFFPLLLLVYRSDYADYKAMPIETTEQLQGMAKEWARDKAAREMAAHQAAIERQKRHRLEFEIANGSPTAAILNNPDFSITEMLQALTALCVSTNSQVAVRVDRFVEFEILVSLPAAASKLELAQMSQCVVSSAGDYIHSLRFVHQGAVVGELDRRTIESIVKDPKISLADIGDQMIADAPSQAGQTRTTATLSNGRRDEAPAENESDEMRRLRETNQAFDTADAQHREAVNNFLSVLNLTADLSKVRSSQQLSAKRQKLDQATQQFKIARQFLENPRVIYEKLLRDHGFSSVYIRAALRGWEQERISSQRAMDRVLKALDQHQLYANTFLQIMEDHWGSWRFKPDGRTIDFDTVEIRDAYRRAMDNVERTSRELSNALREYPGKQAE